MSRDAVRPSPKDFRYRTSFDSTVSVDYLAETALTTKPPSSETILSIMLKRCPRSPSPVPHTSSPPLEVNPHHLLPVTKRRRITGPVIDGTERRDHALGDDGEEDYAEHESDDDTLTNGPPQEKLYAHMNQYLGNLHIEQQYRSRASTSINLSGYHDPQADPPWLPHPAKFTPNVTDSKILSMPVSRQEELVSSGGYDCSSTQDSASGKEREQVISRYMDTNR